MKKFAVVPRQSDVAGRKLVEIAKGVEAVQDGRIYISCRNPRSYQTSRSQLWVKVKNRQHPAMSRVMETFG